MIKDITDPKIWDDFAQSCQPNTFLHSWEWGQVQKATGEGVQYLGLYPLPSSKEGLPLEKGEKTTLIGLALVITVNARRGRHYLIPHGPLFKDQVGVDLYLGEIVAYLRQTAKEDGAVALRVAPLIKTSTESQELFKKLGFRPAPLHIHAELTWVLDIDKSEEELLVGMRKTTRHAILKAQKSGVTTEVITNPTEALERFWPLYEATRQRHGFIVWPKSMVKAQLDIFSEANQIFTVLARYNNEDVAAAILPHFGDTVFYYHGASTKLPGSVPAAQLLQWAAIQEAQRRGAKHYNFWGISPNYTNKKVPTFAKASAGKSAATKKHPFDGITTFKTGFGGYACDYLHAQDLPLSLGYWPLWAIDTYRKFRRGF